MYQKLLMFTLLLGMAQITHALSMEQIVKLNEQVLIICRGGTIIGNSSTKAISGTVSGKVVVIKGLMQGGADARIELTDKEWEGIKALSNPETYNKCVDSTLDKFIKVLEK